jgi:hypothetical protein
MFAFVLLVGLVSFFHWICSETSRATAFDFYDGVSVLWIKLFFRCKSFASFHCNNALSFISMIVLHGWILYSCKDIPILVLLSHDVSITLSIFVGVSLDFIYRNN